MTKWHHCTTLSSWSSGSVGTKWCVGPTRSEVQSLGEVRRMSATSNSVYLKETDLHLSLAQYLLPNILRYYKQGFIILWCGCHFGKNSGIHILEYLKFSSQKQTNQNLKRFKESPHQMMQQGDSTSPNNIHFKSIPHYLTMRKHLLSTKSLRGFSQSRLRFLPPKKLKGKCLHCSKGRWEGTIKTMCAGRVATD